MKNRTKTLVFSLAAVALTALGFSSCAPRRARLSAEEKARADSLRRDSLLRDLERRQDSLDRDRIKDPPIKALYGVRPVDFREMSDSPIKAK